MQYLGEFISIGVAFSWTATALLSEFGSKRLGNLTLNVLRMALALLFSVVLFGVVTGNILPPGASAEACGWMLLSGLVGYVIGDFCLFQCYHYWFALWTTLHDTSPSVCRLDGLGDAWATDDAYEHLGDAGDTLWYQYLCTRTRRAS